MTSKHKTPRAHGPELSQNIRHRLKNLLLGIEVNAEFLGAEKDDPQSLHKIDLIVSAAREAQALLSSPAQEGDEGRAHPARPLQTRRGKILVVDDQAEVGRLVADLLRRQHEVKNAGCGHEALETYAREACDVVLIDLDLAEETGDQVARQIRQMDPCAVILLMTAWPVEEGDPRLSAFDLRLEKPFQDRRAVREAVARALELRDQRLKPAAS